MDLHTPKRRWLLLPPVALWAVVFGGVAFAVPLRVSTAEELLEALAPGRTVVLEPGLYELAGLERIRTNYVSWEEVFDGRQLVVHGLSGLSLRAELGATILAEPRYAFTVSFLGCRDLLLEGLTLGHTEAGYCVGGVVRLERCQGVSLEGCALYGSGTVGMEIRDTRGVSVRDSAISGCTAGAVWADGAAGLVFRDVEILGNDSWPLIGLSGCLEVSFEDCRIAENFGDSLLSADRDCRSVSFAGTVIERNGTDRLVDEYSVPLELSQALIRDNLFYAEQGASGD
jgi:hypothetical protein